MQIKYRHKRVPVASYYSLMGELNGTRKMPGTTPQLLDGHATDYCRSGEFKSSWEPHTHGGVTTCQILDDGEVVAQGVAYCSPSDNFSYRVGRAIAEGRARKQLQQ